MWESSRCIDSQIKKYKRVSQILQAVGSPEPCLGNIASILNGTLPKAKVCPKKKL
jgi:hypothetical protein